MQIRKPMPPPAPDEPLYAVGDIHGRADLLDQLLDRIDAHMTDLGVARARVVFLGDYIDRGRDSARVLETLFAYHRRLPDHVVCLMGNHERMLLDFLDDPAERGARWLRHGGVETLASFGIPDAPDRATPEICAALAPRLRAALPDGLLDWIRALPLWHRSGNIVCAHAGLEPGLPPENQEAKTLLWGPARPRARRDGLWVVHGHTIVHAPRIERGHIAIDTGAYYSDRLTAVALYPGIDAAFLDTATRSQGGSES